MKKLLILMLVLMLATVMFVACGEAQPKDTTPEETTTAVPESTTPKICPLGGNCHKNPCECNKRTFSMSTASYHGNGFEYRNSAEQIAFTNFGEEVNTFLTNNRTRNSLINGVRFEIVIIEGRLRTVYNITNFDNDTTAGRLGFFRARMTGTDFGLAQVGTTYDVQIRIIQNNRVRFESNVFQVGVTPFGGG